MTRLRRSSVRRAIVPLTDHETPPPKRRPGRRAAMRAAALKRTEEAERVAAGAAVVKTRLNKLLASRGLGARRKCDRLIQDGSVRVNGTVVKEPGTQVDADNDQIAVHGRPIPGPSAMRYLMLHKPVGVITTLDDPEGRPTVRTLLPPGPRLFPVGRLDAETSGLLIATNDGELAHHLMHPRYGVRKVYRVRIDRPADPQQIVRLRTGVEFEPRVMSAPCEVRMRNARAARAEIEIALHEGRYRQVRRMCEAVGLAVKGLHRSAYGPLRIGTLPRGAWRDLTKEEVRRLRAASERPVPRVPSIRRIRGAGAVTLPRMPGAPGTGAGSRGSSARPMSRPPSARPASPGTSRGPMSRGSASGPMSRPRGDRPMPRHTGGRPAPRREGGRPSRPSAGARSTPRFTGPRPPQRSAGKRPLAPRKGVRPERFMGRDRMTPRPAGGRPVAAHARGRSGAGATTPGFRGPRSRPQAPRAGPRMGQRPGRTGPPRPSGRDRRPRQPQARGRSRTGPDRPRTQGRPPRH
jgi:23S rRNA pseudouridine2605 synthase